MGQLMRGVEGQGCHNFYPECPFSNQDVLQIAKRINFKWCVSSPPNSVNSSLHPVTYTPFLVNFVIWFFVVLAFVQLSVINILNRTVTIFVSINSFFKIRKLQGNCDKITEVCKMFLTSGSSFCNMYPVTSPPLWVLTEYIILWDSEYTFPNTSEHHLKEKTQQ